MVYYLNTAAGSEKKVSGEKDNAWVSYELLVILFSSPRNCDDLDNLDRLLQTIYRRSTDHLQTVDPVSAAMRSCAGSVYRVQTQTPETFAINKHADLHGYHPIQGTDPTMVEVLARRCRFHGSHLVA